jgi:hypothetical protein
MPAKKRGGLLFFSLFPPFNFTTERNKTQQASKEREREKERTSGKARDEGDLT